MNQSNLYATLSYSGCKILSFEDFPSNHGSWRVSFLVSNTLCEVTCNRQDNLLILSSNETNSATTQSLKLLTEQLELAKMNEWLRALLANNKLPSNMMSVQEIQNA